MCLPPCLLQYFKAVDLQRDLVLLKGAYASIHKTKNLKGTLVAMPVILVWSALAQVWHGTRMYGGSSSSDSSLLSCSHCRPSPITSHLGPPERSPAFSLNPTSFFPTAARAFFLKLKSDQCHSPAYIPPWLPIALTVRASLFTLPSKPCGVWSLPASWILTLAHYTHHTGLFLSFQHSGPSATSRPLCLLFFWSSLGSFFISARMSPPQRGLS